MQLTNIDVEVHYRTNPVHSLLAGGTNTRAASCFVKFADAEGESSVNSLPSFLL